jgi:hypothetical protein
MMDRILNHQEHFVFDSFCWFPRWTIWSCGITPTISGAPAEA